MIPNTSASNSAGLVSDSYNKFSGTRGGGRGSGVKVGDRVSGANVSITGGQAGPQFKSLSQSRIEEALAERDAEEALNPMKKIERQKMEKQLEMQRYALRNPGEYLDKYEKQLSGQSGQTPETIAQNMQNTINWLKQMGEVTGSRIDPAALYRRPYGGSRI